MKKRQAKKLRNQVIRSIDYLVGFTGVGPTLFDVKPHRLFSEGFIKRFPDLYKAMIEEKAFRKNSFRQAVIDVTGEDPETDWT